jgi:hypothetical protein
MNDPFDSTPLERHPIGADPSGRGGEGPGAALYVGIVVAVLAAAAGWFWYRSRSAAPAPPVATATPAPAPAPAAAAPPAEPLPTLDASDPYLRATVAKLSSHPELAAWLVDEGLARRFVGAVVNVAEGTSPASHLGALRPAEPFEARRSGSRLYIDSASFRRYDLATDVFESIDAQGAAGLYRRIEPLLDQAYLEIGDPQASFRQTLARAIGRLAEVPVPAAPIELTLGGVSYQFASHDLEGRTLAEKHLLRMGPENAKRVQAKLRELAAALGLDVSTGPPPEP